MKGTLDVVSFSACMRQPDKHGMTDWVEYWSLCEEIDATRANRDLYERRGQREAAKTCKVRLLDLMHRKLRVELELSTELARAS